MKNKKLNPVHLGKNLEEDLMIPLGVTKYRLAKDIHVSPRRINEMVKGKRAVSANTALRLSRYFGNSAKFWLNLQAQYDLEVEEDKMTDKLDAIIKPYKDAA